MKIQQIRMINFRGFSGEQIIKFEGKPFVLLSAPNGSGKTTIIDAIEWCLTGNIGRLREAYDNRSTNAEERKRNCDGILKNKDAKEDEYVEVELTYWEEEKEFCLSRKQREDKLDNNESEILLNGDQEFAKRELEKIVSNSFYNFHFCNVQKSFGIQSRKRKDLPELFTEFITDYSKETTIADNLDIFAEDVNRYKSDLQSEKIPFEQIEEKRKKKEKYDNGPGMLSYPQQLFFEEEILDISKMEEQALHSQLDKLYLCGDFVASKYLDKLVEDNSKCEVLDKLGELKNLLKEHQDEINEAITNNLNRGNAVIEAVSNKIREYEAIHLMQSNIKENASLILSFQSEKFGREFYEKAMKEIDDNEKNLRNLENDIKHLTEGNVVLSAFSTLLSQREGIRKYQEESERCPICGSTQFGELDAMQILSEASDYIQRNNKIVCDKNEEKNEVKRNVSMQYKELVEITESVLVEEIEKQKEIKKKYEELKKKTESFFSVVDSLITRNGVEYTLEELTTLTFIEEKQRELEKSLLKTEEKDQYRKQYQDILNLTGHNNESEAESAIAERIREIAKESPPMIEFNYSLWVQKINAINSVRNHKEYMECVKKLKEYEEINHRITDQEKQYDTLYEKAIKRADTIRQLVEKLKREEYESVGPNLKKYYKKLSRIDSIESIDIVFEKDQISIIDEKGKSLVNILSNGQLSVFMLAYFFAGIANRSKTEKCKLYFIDDLTACMDDVNMLAFLDLLKYQMVKGKSIEQLFFVTCDDRICQLLRYKLEGCKVDYCEIGERELRATL